LNPKRAIEIHISELVEDAESQIGFKANKVCRTAIKRQSLLLTLAFDIALIY
jgi:hypothetical protein